MIIRNIFFLGIILSAQYLTCMDDQSDLILEFTTNFYHQSFTHAKQTLQKIEIIPESNQLSILCDLVNHARDYSDAFDFSFNQGYATNKNGFIEIVSILVEKHRLSLNTVLPHNALGLPLAIIASTAEETGNVSMLEIFLKNGANPDMQAIAPLSIIETHALSWAKEVNDKEKTTYNKPIMTDQERVLRLLKQYTKEYDDSSMDTIATIASCKLAKSREQSSKQ
jgi:hypothetical protein